MLGLVNRCLLALTVGGVSALGPAQALIGGESTPAESVSTVELSIDHPGERAGQCSGVVVGHNPLTILTTGHCFRRPALDAATGLPSLRIRSAPAGYNARLTAAIYNPPETIDRNHAHDLAVLTFETQGPSPWPIVPLASPSTAREFAGTVLICGYGSAVKQLPTPNPRCLDRPTLSHATEITNFIPLSYQALDPAAFARYQGQFNDVERSISSIKHYLVINRLRDGVYAADLPMPREGDSGGPWFSRNELGQLRLIAVSELVQTFRIYTKLWPVFSGPNADHFELPYAYYGLKIQAPESHEIIKRARAAGADIHEDD